MEEETVPASNPKGISPALIVGIIVLVVVLAVGAYIMSTRSASSPTTPNVVNEELTPTIPETAPSPSTQNTVKELLVEGSNFKFVPKNFSVNLGDTVKITFKNVQGNHNLLIDEFNVKTKTIPADKADEVTFVANKKGSFEFYCGIGNHKALGMVGTLTVN